MDFIVDSFVNSDFCDAVADEHCPAILEWVLMNGIPLLSAAGPAMGGLEDFTQVSRA